MTSCTQVFPLTLMAAIAMVTMSAGAAADEAKATRQSVQDQLRPMDTDKDGKLSAAEHAAGARQLFARIDKNKDGKLSVAELDAVQREIDPSIEDPDWAARMKGVDTDGDGSLNASEHAAASRKMFETMDSDRDEFVTAAEMQVMEERIAAGGKR